MLNVTISVRLSFVLSNISFAVVSQTLAVRSNEREILNYAQRCVKKEFYRLELFVGCENIELVGCKEN